ncbi:MAG: transcription factor FapR [Bacillota bacterium]|nr:transcription factor FapR [Bacillota bacterium]
MKVVGTITRRAKAQRQRQLAKLIEQNPFLTDKMLAQILGVSVQTIRLDRAALKIPELRERMKQLARGDDQVKSLTTQEVIGQIVDLQLDKGGISLLDIEERHVFVKTKIARGHHVFAQANSLAVAVIDAELALTASARLRFIRPVRMGERLVAKARVLQSDRSRSKVRVETFSGEDLVFVGDFWVYRGTRLP